jgi:hypothetical protein
MLRQTCIHASKACGLLKQPDKQESPNRTSSPRLRIVLQIQFSQGLPTCDPDLLKAIQELLESGAVSTWGDQGGLFVAVTVDLKEVFGRKGSIVDFLPELKWNDGILIAVDDQKWGVDFL